MFQFFLSSPELVQLGERVLEAILFIVRIISGNLFVGSSSR